MRLGMGGEIKGVKDDGCLGVWLGKLSRWRWCFWFFNLKLCFVYVILKKLNLVFLVSYLFLEINSYNMVKFFGKNVIINFWDN